ncbi:MAG: hypothetical protein ACRDZ3_08850 [Acidimicrobiia bacterium]
MPSEPGERPGDTRLQAAREAEASLRRRLAGLAADRSRADAEADRLERRSTIPDGRGLAEPAAAHRARSVALAAEMEATRKDLRAAEATVARLEAGI